MIPAHKTPKRIDFLALFSEIIVIEGCVVKLIIFSSDVFPDFWTKTTAKGEEMKFEKIQKR